MNQSDEKSCRYADKDKYPTISALLSSASAVAAVAVSGQWARIAELVATTAQLATDLKHQRRTRRTNGTAHPALPPCATVPKLPRDYRPDWIAIPPEYRQGVRYPGREGPCPNVSRACSRA